MANWAATVVAREHRQVEKALRQIYRDEQWRNPSSARHRMRHVLRAIGQESKDGECAVRPRRMMAKTWSRPPSKSVRNGLTDEALEAGAGDHQEPGIACTQTGRFRAPCTSL